MAGDKKQVIKKHWTKEAFPTSYVKAEERHDIARKARIINCSCYKTFII